MHLERDFTDWRAAHFCCQMRADGLIILEQTFRLHPMSSRTTVLVYVSSHANGLVMRRGCKNYEDPRLVISVVERTGADRLEVKNIIGFYCRGTDESTC
jgi:hypothetical protein